jgi:hypothetical protein
MTTILEIIAAIVMFSLQAVMAWALVEVAIEMFRHRDETGVHYMKPDPRYDMGKLFDRLPADKFHQTN